VGAIFAQDNRTGRVFVREVPPGMGAAQAGVREGDEVTQIDGKPVAQMSPEQVHRALQGKVGSKVTLSLAGIGGERTLVVERSPLQTAPGPAAPSPSGRP
jgi:carboxyl-terminal processing protease